jgi:peptidoglycan/xylan/chitin deacetylase (PgdA/CDA1 family)
MERRLIKSTDEIVQTQSFKLISFMKSKIQSLALNCKLNKRTGDIFTWLLMLVFIVLLGDITNAQQQSAKFPWPEGKKMALSLSFDDARLSQPDKGIPLLDKYGVKATFYLIPSAMEQRLDGWKKAVKSGHDIGNHSLSHPCTGNFDWSRDNALEDYTLQGMGMQLDSANKLLKKELGVQAVSFAFPCGQTFVGRGKNIKSYIPVVSAMFETARLWLSEGPNDPSFCDMSQLTGMELDGKSFEQAKKIIESAKSKGQWLIFAGHEMNDSGTQTSRLSTIEAICKYALDPANGIWINTVHSVASYVKEKRGEKPFADTLAYKNPLLPINQRIDDLLSRMTLKEKVGQMNIPTCYSMELGYGLGSHGSGEDNFEVSGSIADFEIWIEQ